MVFAVSRLNFTHSISQNHVKEGSIWIRRLVVIIALRTHGVQEVVQIDAVNVLRGKVLLQEQEQGRMTVDGVSSNYKNLTLLLK